MLLVVTRAVGEASCRVAHPPCSLHTRGIGLMETWPLRSRIGRSRLAHMGEFECR